MENLNTDAEISFRFNHLDKMQAFTLEREILGAFSNNHVENNRYVVCVPLTDKNFDDINDYYVRQRVEIDDCDIFISVSADSGTNSIDIPTIVNRMLKYIDCKLTFSFTVV
ncbi:MAG: hypothetical protein V7780_10815 [Colwellia sp.]